MKRLIALLLTLTLCLSMAGAAGAMYYSEQFLDVELEDYTWESALEVIFAYGFEGCIVKVEGLDVAIWIPDEMDTMPLTDELIEEGFLAVYEDWMEALAIEIVHYKDLNTTFEDYVAYLKANKMKKVTPTEINGMQFVIYRDPAYWEDVTCRVAAMVCEDGSVLEFVTYTDEDVYELIRNVVFASIQRFSAIQF